MKSHEIRPARFRWFSLRTALHDSIPTTHRCKNERKCPKMKLSLLVLVNIGWHRVKMDRNWWGEFFL